MTREARILELRQLIHAARKNGVDATDLWRQLHALTAPETRPAPTGEHRA